ncbi:MAG TPA: hypothetical protein VLG71_02490 [Candidatus Limnocylindria bacterium]|nr:hypothetical protein [Candidatus Limnocylindria bacterium]
MNIRYKIGFLVAMFTASCSLIAIDADQEMEARVRIGVLTDKIQTIKDNLATLNTKLESLNTQIKEKQAQRIAHEKSFDNRYSSSYGNPNANSKWSVRYREAFNARADGLNNELAALYSQGGATQVEIQKVEADLKNATDELITKLTEIQNAGSPDQQKRTKERLKKLIDERDERERLKKQKEDEDKKAEEKAKLEMAENHARAHAQEHSIQNKTNEPLKNIYIAGDESDAKPNTNIILDSTRLPDGVLVPGATIGFRFKKITMFGIGNDIINVPDMQEVNAQTGQTQPATATTLEKKSLFEVTKENGKFSVRGVPITYTDQGVEVITPH